MRKIPGDPRPGCFCCAFPDQVFREAMNRIMLVVVDRGKVGCRVTGHPLHDWFVTRRSLSVELLSSSGQSGNKSDALCRFDCPAGTSQAQLTSPHSLEVKSADGLSIDRRKFVADLEEWQVHGFMVVSMFFQLLLLGTGGNRKRSNVLRLVAWISYNVADAVALYTLGLMVNAAWGSGRDTNIVFSLWGPILLLHLGAPDNITAYSNADTELWSRHGLTMVIQVGFVLYLIARIGSGPYLTCAIALLIAGCNKYAERTFALYYGSKTAIVDAVQPIYKYMSLEHEQFQEDEYHYILVGEEDWYQTMLDASSKTGSYMFGESVSNARRLVRYQELVDVSDKALPGKEHLLDLCLAHALFKMLRRRLVGLYFYEREHEKTMNLYTVYLKDPDRIIRVLDMELRFLFDSIYTKANGTAFTRVGLCFRVLNLCLVLVSFLFLVAVIHVYGNSSQYYASWVITMTLVVGGIGIEVYQLLRISLSDWTQVRLACACLRACRREKADCCRVMDSAVQTVCFTLLSLRHKMGKLRHDYWSQSFRQHSMIPVHKHERSVFEKHVGARAYRVARRAVRKVLGNGAMIQLDWMPVRVLPKLQSDTVKRKLLEKILLICGSSEEYMGDVMGDTLLLPENEAFSFASDTDLEHAILHWHIATAICELKAEGEHGSAPAGNNAEFSKYLSRYVMYLMVAKTELLPCHPDIARGLYDATVQELDRRWSDHSDIHNEGRDLDFITPSPSVIDSGIELAHRLMEAEEGRRWSLLGDVWCDFVVHIALANKPSDHVEQLTVGGEFLTHIWALLVQMGFQAK